MSDSGKRLYTALCNTDLYLFKSILDETVTGNETISASWLKAVLENSDARFVSLLVEYKVFYEQFHPTVMPIVFENRRDILIAILNSTFCTLPEYLTMGLIDSLHELIMCGGDAYIRIVIKNNSWYSWYNLAFYLHQANDKERVYQLILQKDSRNEDEYCCKHLALSYYAIGTLPESAVLEMLSMLDLEGTTQHSYLLDRAIEFSQNNILCYLLRILHRDLCKVYRDTYPECHLFCSLRERRIK